MMTKQEIENRIVKLVEEYGEWTFDIPLPDGVWTGGNRGIPHTRLKRVSQIIQDVSPMPIGSCRILDLGCLDGIFSIEFALHGARVTGVDARDGHIRKALLAKEALGLKNVDFVQDDVRNLSVQKYGKYDVILCSGILYHLNTPDVFVFIENMYEMVGKLVIIDTHVSLNPMVSVIYKGKEYHGHIFQEHWDSASEEVKLRRLLGSYGNDTSFWFSRPSLINFLSHTGFSSIYECFNPPHLNCGRPGLEHKDRCTFVAIKGQQLKLHTSPAANNLEEDWPEASLSYIHRKEYAPTILLPGFIWRVISKLKYVVGMWRMKKE